MLDWIVSVFIKDGEVRPSTSGERFVMEQEDLKR